MGHLIGVCLSLFCYLLGTASRKADASVASTWPRANAVVKEASLGAEFFNASVEVTYVFKGPDTHYSGITTRNFFTVVTANKFAKRCAPGTNLVIRFDPKNPDKSCILDQDQKFAA